MLKISTTLNALPKIKVSELQQLQGDLKTLSPVNFEKLKKRLEKGFKYPLIIWKKGKINYIVDGHQRVSVIQKIYGDVGLPYIEIKAKSIEDAKVELLAISSQYGKVDKVGFQNFVEGLGLQKLEMIEHETVFNNMLKGLEKTRDIGGSTVIDKHMICVTFDSDASFEDFKSKLGIFIADNETTLNY